MKGLSEYENEITAICILLYSDIDLFGIIAKRTKQTDYEKRGRNKGIRLDVSSIIRKGVVVNHVKDREGSKEE